LPFDWNGFAEGAADEGQGVAVGAYDASLTALDGLYAFSGAGIVTSAFGFGQPFSSMRISAPTSQLGQVGAGIGAAMVVGLQLVAGGEGAGAVPGGDTIMFHGTDVPSGLKFLNGEDLSAAKAAAGKIDGPPGFFLSTHAEDAMYFASRRGSGTVLQYRFSPSAAQALGGLEPTPLGALGKVGWFRGGEVAIPTDSFELFNSLRASGQITVTPFRF
jgi:hypothetical protein